MKYIFYSFIAIICFILISLIGNFNVKKVEINNVDMLRIHIRANSNLDVDQQIKYVIKDSLLSFITPLVSLCETKKEVENLFLEKKDNIINLINDILNENGFNYGCDLKINNEYFPIRVYGENVVENGFYDALIINLGQAKGENWWCVAYPPLCFSDFSESANQIVYKSRFMEIIELFYNK